MNWCQLHVYVLKCEKLRTPDQVTFTVEPPLMDSSSSDTCL